MFSVLEVLNIFLVGGSNLFEKFGIDSAFFFANIVESAVPELFHFLSSHKLNFCQRLTFDVRSFKKALNKH